VYIILTLQAAR